MSAGLALGALDLIYNSAVYLLLVKTMKYLDLAFPAVALAVLLTACTPAAVEETSPPLPSQVGSAVPAPVALPLQQTVWAWQYTQLNGVRLAPITPLRYTLTFHEENRVAVVADCNRGGTVYRTQGNQLSFDQIAMTKILCPADSSDRDFFDGLHAVEHYRIDDKTLTLQLRSGGEMVFAPAQP
ncbi:MAG: META domain-containing protein [Proteobacteria bacterium]|nr:META domain-containing protein [Pseudomonadota bacterium]